MDWIGQIEIELHRIQPNENPGRTRTIARRIAGIALKQIYKDAGDDFIILLKRATNDPAFPETVQSSAQRLSARLSTDFQSPSVDPIGDAKIISDYIQHTIKP